MRVIVNEWLTEPIPLSRGVRQGDSLSPMLYILCVETLACQIRSCSQIEGFLLPGANGSQYKVGIYADDTTSLVKSVYSLAALFRVINVYERGPERNSMYPKQRPCGWARGALALISRLASHG